jgi:hypothetical protein
MKIGYPCINTSIQRHHTSTFRLASYSEMRLIQTIRDNLAHLEKILKFNVENRLLFFELVLILFLLLLILYVNLTGYIILNRNLNS